jgi:hypothetical protein
MRSQRDEHTFVGSAARKPEPGQRHTRLDALIAIDLQAIAGFFGGCHDHFARAASNLAIASEKLPVQSIFVM